MTSLATVRIPVTAYIEAEVVLGADGKVIDERLSAAIVTITATTRTLVVENTQGERIIAYPLHADTDEPTTGTVPASAIRDYDEPLPLNAEATDQ